MPFFGNGKNGCPSSRIPANSVVVMHSERQPLHFCTLFARKAKGCCLSAQWQLAISRSGKRERVAAYRRKIMLKNLWHSGSLSIPTGAPREMCKRKSVLFLLSQGQVMLSALISLFQTKYCFLCAFLNFRAQEAHRKLS